MGKPYQIQIDNVKLSRNCRDSLIDLAAEIETASWLILSDSYDFSDMRNGLVKAIRDILNIPNDIEVLIDSFNTPIMSFENGEYPNYQ